MRLSTEQESVVNAAVAGHNIIVNAVAGAGKTATALAIAKAMTDHYILQVTYNRKLKQEVRQRVKKSGIANMVVSNYHSLCLDYYGDHTDAGLRHVAEGLLAPLPSTDDPFSVLIIDEAQDMTPLYYNFLRTFVKDFCKVNCQIIVFGDVMQAVYEFKGADPTYLSAADRHWSPRVFKRIDLTYSYRVPSEVANLVNALAGRRLITSGKGSSGVEVSLLANYNNRCPVELLEIYNDLEEGSILPADVMVILPSADTSCATSFINRLATKIPIYKQMDDEASSEERYSRNKVLVCTYHTSKGLERDTVVIFNFDRSYFTYYQPEATGEELIPTLYVGLTRTLRRLYIVENGERCVFFPSDYVSQLRCGKVRGEPRPISSQERTEISVWKLCKFLPTSLEYQLSIYVTELYNVHTPAGKPIKVRKDVRNRYGTKEYVGDIIAAGVIEYFASLRLHKPTRSEDFLESYEGSPHVSIEYVERELVKIRQCRAPETLFSGCLRAVTLALACRTGHLYRYRQIGFYDWIERSTLFELLANISFITNDAIFHNHLSRKTDDGLAITAELDSIEEEQIVSIKTVEELSYGHKLRFIVDVWVSLGSIDQRNYFLCNTLTGERLQLSNIDGIDRLVADIIATRR